MKDSAKVFGIFSDWRPFPDPRHGGWLEGPFGPGCYELRYSDTRELLLCGSSAHVCWRITSLLPAPFGQGTRNDSKKRRDVWNNLARVEYRTMACEGVQDARETEVWLLMQNRYIHSK